MRTSLNKIAVRCGMLALLSLSQLTWAAEPMAMAMSSQPMASKPVPASQNTLSDGIVRGVDAPHATLTIEHGALANIGMPAMTMDYHAADPALLHGIKTGDPIKFRVENVHGALAIVKLVKVQ